jgi:succinate dehydrogenase / fumarate reductase flavoprotein subunit
MEYILEIIIMNTINVSEEEKVNIIGAGLAGLSAAVTLAKKGIHSRLISVQASERAQSVMAEGGINGVLNTMGEADTVENHFADTIKAGCDIADKEAVRGMTETAPYIIKELEHLGVPFNRNADGTIMQRNFGGQKKKRTAYAKSSTGKIIMTALIDEVRKFEVQGLIERFPSHELVRLWLEENKKDQKTLGVVIKNTYTDEIIIFSGPVILACGGLNGFFPERTTGTTANSGEAAAIVFSQGVVFSNLEMIQYHPTTIKISGKRCLISEAARGEGGRVFILRVGKPWYFMEEKYPELGNLMPRDVVSREMYFAIHDNSLSGQIYLDMTGLSQKTWKNKLPDLRQEIIDYLGIDPAETPVPVEPGIHYFMGGIDVDTKHHTNVERLYAAGECCSLYHGANRLGGNSLLGAVYGGITAAETLYEDCFIQTANKENIEKTAVEYEKIKKHIIQQKINASSPELILEVSDILYGALGIVRNESEMKSALNQIEKLIEINSGNESNLRRLNLAKMMISSAIYRKESRGAHYRSDYPERDMKFQRYIKCDYSGIIDGME